MSPRERVPSLLSLETPPNNCKAKVLLTYSNFASAANIDGAIDLLEMLSERYRLHIITNGFEQVQHFKIKNSGLDSYFDFVFTAEQLGYKKPHPQIFIQALRQTQADPKKSLMIGDSLEADILGAMAQGMHAVHFNSHVEERHDKCLIVDSLDELNTFF